MTRKQRECLDYITRYIAANRVSPTYDEIADTLGLASKSNVFRILAALEQRGFIRKRPNCARSVELVANDDPSEVARRIVMLANSTAVLKRSRGEQFTISDLQPIIEGALRDVLNARAAA